MSHEAINDLARRIRPEFPLLAQEVAGQGVVFLDNASTTPKPRSVISAVTAYYEQCSANVHRGVHKLGAESTRRYDEARLEIASLVGARPDELVMVRGTTEAINLVAHGLDLGKDDEVVFPASEHHANWIPWRLHGKPVPMAIDCDGVPQWDTLKSLITPRTKLVAIGHVSNVTGAIAPVEEVVAVAHEAGIPVLLDAAQSLSHLPVDVKKLGVDFLAGSSHKAFGPSGVGFLYSTRDWLARFPLYQVGGGMVSLNEDIGVGGFTPRDAPFKFEAGTPAIEATIGFGAAVRWMRAIGMDHVRQHDVAMAKYLVDGLSDIPGVRVLAAKLPPERRIALATFVVDAPSMTQENVARALCDMFGVCVSGGFHCTHVLHARAKLAGTVRASPHVFNTTEDVDRLLEGVREIAG
ncbi:MAG: cysteine desulfurase [Myxococcales bacterium]|jgi:cysteine desulfurase/selenocysteine lyase|nr:cysteine desulfurase [Myxococcales bacterium]